MEAKKKFITVVAQITLFPSLFDAGTEAFFVCFAAQCSNLIKLP